MRRRRSIGILLVAFLIGAYAFAQADPPRCHVGGFDVRAMQDWPRAAERGNDSAPPDGAFQIVLNVGATLAAHPEALAAWALAVGELESLIGDPVTVVISADLGPLDPGVVGSTTLSPWIAPYDTVRDAMMGDAGSTESDLLAQLPTFQDLNVQLPPGFTLNANVFFATANCRALGLACPNNVDAAITFSSTFPFDFDPSNGIAPNKIDFVGVAVHEMIHALGFITIVDTVDATLFTGEPPFAVPPTPLDLVRLAGGAGATDFTSAVRLLSPGALTPDHVCYDGLVDVRFSEGLFNGDGWQASHWRDDTLPPFFDFGIMDPNVSFGRRRQVSARDIRALDLIGWDLNSIPGPDCNENGTPDAQDVAIGGSHDCNGNIIPDECDVVGGGSGDCDGDLVPDECVLGDADGDGDVDLMDFAVLIDCTTSPNGGPVGGSCSVFDADCDGDADWSDFGSFQLLYGQP